MRKHNKLRVWENSQVGLLWWSVGSRWGMKGMKGWWEEWFEQIFRDTEWCLGGSDDSRSDERSVWEDMEHQIRDHCSHWQHWAFQTLHWWWGKHERVYFNFNKRVWWEECSSQVWPCCNIVWAWNARQFHWEWYLLSISIYTLLLSPPSCLQGSKALSPDQEKKRQVAELCCVEQKQASEDRKSNGTKLKSFRVLIWIGSCPGRISEYWTYPMNDLGLCVEEMGLKISVKGFTVYTFSLQPPAVDWDTWLWRKWTQWRSDKSHPGSWHGEVWRLWCSPSALLFTPQTLTLHSRLPQESEGGAGLTNSIGINIHNIPHSAHRAYNVILFDLCDSE